MPKEKRTQLPPDVYKTLRSSPIYWPARPLQRLTSFYTPRTVETEHSDRTRIFVTGHMIDQNPNKDRFPDKPENILSVRTALWRQLDSIYERDREKGVELVLCSATAGADLLAMEWAMIKMDDAQNNGRIANISLDINLPFAEQDFLPEAVEHASGEHYPWLTIYNQAKSRGLVHEPRWKSLVKMIKPGEPVRKADLNAVYKSMGKPDWQSFVDLNMYMTSKLRPGDFVVAVWDGKGGITPGGTQHGLTMSEPIVGIDNIFILNSGINNEGEAKDYDRYYSRIQTAPEKSEVQALRESYDQLHSEAVERWEHSSVVTRRGQTN